MLVIGLTGTKAGGKGEVTNYLKSKADFIYFSLSDEVREEAKKRGLKDYTISQLQDIGNELREKYGLSVLAERVIDKIKREQQNKKTNFIVDGIRNPGEINALRKLDGFKLISVDAPQKQRYEFLVKRGRESDPKNWQDFLVMEKRDLGVGEENIGQQVAACMKLADFHIYNDSTLESLHKKADDILKEIESIQNKIMV